MRGSDDRDGDLFSYVDIEDRIPATHPLRAIRALVNEVLAALDGEFSALYAASGSLWACIGAHAANNGISPASSP